MGSTTHAFSAGATWKSRQNPLAFCGTIWLPLPDASLRRGFAATTPGYAGGGNKFDLEQWDAEYFKRFHDFLAAASERGIVVEISLFSSHYGDVQWNLSPFHPANNVNGTELADWKKINTLENGKILSISRALCAKAGA